MLILAGVVSLQFGAALAATIFPLVGPVTVVSLRLTVAAAALIVAGRGLRLPTRGRGGWAAPVGMGVVLAQMNSCVYLAIDRLPLGVVITLEFLGPLGVALAYSRRRRDAALALVAAAGVVLLTGGVRGAQNLVGIGFALAAGAGWALYIVLNRELARQASGDGLALASVLAAALVAPVALGRAGTAVLQPRVLLIGAAVGVLSSALPYTADRLALRRIGAGTFGVMMSVHPAVAALAGLVVLGQQLRPQQLAGMALVIVASAIAAATPSSPGVRAEPDTAPKPGNGTDAPPLPESAASVT
jgi:inner membrane transporter RhtA